MAQSLSSSLLPGLYRGRSSATSPLTHRGHHPSHTSPLSSPGSPVHPTPSPPTSVGTGRFVFRGRSISVLVPADRAWGGPRGSRILFVPTFVVSTRRPGRPPSLPRVPDPLPTRAGEGPLLLSLFSVHAPVVVPPPAPFSHHRHPLRPASVLSSHPGPRPGAPQEAGGPRRSGPPRRRRGHSPLPPDTPFPLKVRDS